MHTLPYTRADTDTPAVPASVPVPVLKISARTPAQRDSTLLTPRSLHAAEAAHAESEAAALSAEQAAAAAKFRAEEAAAEAKATPRSEQLAEEAKTAAASAAAASQRATVAGSAVNASVGNFTLVYEHGWGRFVRERYATESDAHLVASTLWGSWIIYHEQRGAYTEVATGGLFFRHAAIRKSVSTAMRQAVNQAYGFSGTYASNY